jgi:UDP-N-acetyl-D-galactosamine dehydrogenase
MQSDSRQDTDPIAVIGLGYVGLPLAVEFAKRRPVIGFDVNSDRIEELRAGRDSTREVDAEELASAIHLDVTDRPDRLSTARIYIVTVPTPIDAHKRPDLAPLMRASETVGAVLKVGDLVIYESTVYPGATEEDCVPVLERVSGLRFNRDFFCGYSPERINPGTGRTGCRRSEKSPPVQPPRRRTGSMRFMRPSSKRARTRQAVSASRRRRR